MGRRRLVLLAALTSFGPMSLDLYLPAFPGIAATYGTDTASVQLTFSAALVGLGAGQVLWGPMSDRHGRRRPMLAGLALFVAASLLIAVAPSLAAVVALRVVQAVGGSAGIVVSRAMVRDSFQGADLARALSAIVTVFAAAPVLAPVVGSTVLLVGGWQWTFVLLAAFGAACLAAVLRMPETLPPDRRTDHGLRDALRQYAAIAADARFRPAAAVAALGSLALFAYISSSPAVFIDGYGFGQGVFALLFAGIATTFAVGAQVNMRLLARVPVAALLRRAVLVQLAAAAGVLAAALAVAPAAVLVAPIALVMTTVAAVNSNALALAVDPFPRAAGSASALAGGLQQAASGVAAAVLSALAGRPAVEMGVCMVVAAGSSAALSAAAGRRRRG